MVAPEIVNLKGWITLIDEEQLKTIFESVLIQAEFTILNFHSHSFPENGYTAFWLLAESHLAIHTFTENQVSYIELSSCNYKKTNIFKLLCDKLEGKVSWDGEIQVTKPHTKTEYSF